MGAFPVTRFRQERHDDVAHEGLLQPYRSWTMNLGEERRARLARDAGEKAEMGRDVLLDQRLEVMATGRLVYGVDMSRVLNGLNEVLELRGRIAREPGEGGLLPEEG